MTNIAILQLWCRVFFVIHDVSDFVLAQPDSYDCILIYEYRNDIEKHLEVLI